MAPMKTSTTTLGCPGWDLATIVGNLAEYGYDAVDLRFEHDSLTNSDFLQPHCASFLG